MVGAGVALHINTYLLVESFALDSYRVLLAIQEKLKWEGRKARIEEKLAKVRARKREALRQLEEIKGRIAQLAALSTTEEADRGGHDAHVRMDVWR